MFRKTQILVAIAALAAVLLSACGSAATPTAAPVQPPPAAPVEQPTQSQPAAPAPTVQQFAPVCQSAASCDVPVVPDTVPSDTYCVEKIPYQNISVPPGTTFEVLDKSGAYSCKDSGTVVDGKTVLTCTGPQLYTFDLKLTNASCGTNLLVGTGQCQDGYGFDAAQQCCSPVPAADAASVIVKVNMGACPGPQP
jgi:hypothetical protein